MSGCAGRGAPCEAVFTADCSGERVRGLRLRSLTAGVAGCLSVLEHVTSLLLSVLPLQICLSDI